MVMDLLPLLRPIDPRLALVDLVGVGHACGSLRRQSQRSFFQRGKRAQHQVGAEPRQLIVQIAGRRIVADRHALRHGDRAGVETFLHLHHHHPGLVVAGHDGAMDRRRAAPARQERGMKIEAAEREGFQNHLRQNQAIGDDDCRVGIMIAQRCCGVVAAQCLRCEDGKSQPLGFASDGTRPRRHSAPGRLRHAGIDRYDLMAAAVGNLDKRRHGEIGRAHEHQAERQSRLHLLGCFGEFFDDAVAFELGNMVDEKHAVGVIDLMLQAGREQAFGLDLVCLTVEIEILDLD